VNPLRRQRLAYWFGWGVYLSTALSAAIWAGIGWSVQEPTLRTVAWLLFAAKSYYTYRWLCVTRWSP
jgi:hypothetical protein